MAVAKRKLGNGISQNTQKKSKPTEPEQELSSEDEDEPSVQSFDQDESADELDVSSSDEEEEDEEDVQNDDFVPKDRKALPVDAFKEAASREAHQKQKEKLNDRKSAKPHADKLARSKTLWAQINRKKVPKAERQKIIEELYALISGSVVDIIFKHDASRIVQACFKFGSEQQRTTILKELKGRLVELSKSTYGKFLVVKMLFYGNAQHRSAVLSEIHGNVRKLIRHKEAAYVVEDAFREYTTPVQQEALVSEMYGAEFAVFENAAGQSLAQILQKSPEKRDTIMKNLWDSLDGSIKKGSIGFTIIHRALLIFLKNANAPEKLEAIEAVKELLPEVVHTKDGSEVACYIIALSSAKDRKAIMKSFRNHIDKAMCDEYGWMAVVALCMCVDDTVLLTKAYVPDIEKKCVSLFEDRHARKVFLYLLGNLQSRYYTVPEMTVFKNVQEMKQNTSKKDDELRRGEILQPLSEILVSTLVDNMEGMLKDPNASSLLVEIILHAPTDRQQALDTLLNHFSGAPSSTLAEHSPRFLKTLVQGGFYNKSTKSIEKIEPSINFATQFAPFVTARASEWTTGDGSFVVLALLETLDADVSECKDLQAALVNARPQIEEAAAQDNRGSKIVLTKL